MAIWLVEDDIDDDEYLPHKCIGPGGDCGPPDEWRRFEPYAWYGMVPCPVHVRDDPFTTELRQMARDAGKGYLLDPEEFLKVYPELRCNPPDTCEDW